MTEEEIKNLKPGDKFTVEYTSCKNSDDEILAKIVSEGMDYYTHFSKDSVALSKSHLVKPAPTFNVGDTVRIVPDPLTHTIYNKEDVFDLCFHGKAVKIADSVDAKGDVAIATETGLDTLSIHCLELVKKAVKDKYKVQADACDWEVVVGACVVASYDRCNHPNAEAAAKAECDRLNAEWRKQQAQQ